MRIISDGLYRMYVALCHSQFFRRKAMLAVLETVKAIDTAAIDQEMGILPAVELSEHASSIFGGLLRLAIANRSDALYFLQDVQGYEFLEQRLSRAQDRVLYISKPHEEEKAAPPLPKPSTPARDKPKTHEKLTATPVLKSKKVPELKSRIAKKPSEKIEKTHEGKPQEGKAHEGKAHEGKAHEKMKT